MKTEEKLLPMGKRKKMCYQKDKNTVNSVISHTLPLVDLFKIQNLFQIELELLELW